MGYFIAMDQEKRKANGIIIDYSTIQEGARNDRLSAFIQEEVALGHPEDAPNKQRGRKRFLTWLSCTGIIGGVLVATDGFLRMFLRFDNLPSPQITQNLIGGSLETIVGFSFSVTSLLFGCEKLFRTEDIINSLEKSPKTKGYKGFILTAKSTQAINKRE